MDLYACRWFDIYVDGRSRPVNNWLFPKENLHEIVNFPVNFPYCFWLIGIAWSLLFQGFAGYRYGLFFISDSTYAETKDKIITPHPNESVRQIAYGVHHGAFYFLCSFSGFIAWNLKHLDHRQDRESKRLDYDLRRNGYDFNRSGCFCFTWRFCGLPRILFLGNLPYRNLYFTIEKNIMHPLKQFDKSQKPLT